MLDHGGDVIVRTGWRNLRWLDALQKPIDLHKLLGEAGERIDRAIWIACKDRPPLALRLIAVRKSDGAAEAARRAARRQGGKSGYTPSQKTLDAAAGSSSSRRCRRKPFPLKTCSTCIVCDGASSSPSSD